MRSAGTPPPAPPLAPRQRARGRSQLGIEPFDAKTLLASHLVNDNFAVVSDNSKIFHQMPCSPSTAVGTTPGISGSA
jgi:hypothetical protein